MKKQSRYPEAIGSTVIVQLKRERTESGIILSEREERATQDAYVIDIGPDAFKFAHTICSGPWCEIGDSISYVKWGGEPIDGPDPNEYYRVIQDTDIKVKYPKEKIKVGVDK